MDLKSLSGQILETAKKNGITDPEDLVAFALGFKTGTSTSKTAETGFQVDTQLEKPLWSRRRVRVKELLAQGTLSRSLTLFCFRLIIKTLSQAKRRSERT